MRPVIGITCYAEPARFTVWHTPAALLPWDYVRHVERAGGQPVILPPAGDPGELAGRLDGLIVAGGGDVDPGRYGAPQHAKTGYVREFRDDAEFSLVKAALAERLPILGICRGLQVLNVALGGTLVQHLPDVCGTDRHSPAPGVYGRVPVRLEDPLRRLYGTDLITPAHYHHQAVERLAPGLTTIARADDGTIEAVMLDETVWAVQWHPEADEEAPVFGSFVTRAGFRPAIRGR
uniref:gamma-glutamyl-gamma-aminobutyrate hydrolase family protein n=1 Tax=Herbidospora sakaeratensis TaxID=564415 RepID=UPI000784907A|nr:gamma-glutamyl-gamma-aminobutyrate hydrolase family protein [Herbidospora sakaeratensis]